LVTVNAWSFLPVDCSVSPWFVLLIYIGLFPCYSVPVLLVTPVDCCLVFDLLVRLLDRLLDSLSVYVLLLGLSVLLYRLYGLYGLI
jgi:hypothetical protein